MSLDDRDLTFNSYQNFSVVTANRIGVRSSIEPYLMLSVVNVSLALYGILRKSYDCNNITLSSENKDTARELLGDLLRQITLCCEELGLDIEDVAKFNMRKINQIYNDNKPIL